MLSQAGFWVDVFEANETPGGATRTLPLTLPGYQHDFGSAVHPMAATSPFFRSLDLERHGLEWIRSPIPLAHPLDGGRAVCLRQDLREMSDELGADGASWRSLFGPFVENWRSLAPDVLRPVNPLTRHPFLMARFALAALPSAARLAKRFREEPARALFAVIAAHSFLTMEDPLSASFGLVLGIVGHVDGWPIPRGGSASITAALISVLEGHGGRVVCGRRIERLQELDGYAVKICNVTPRQLESMAGDLLAGSERQSLRQFRYGPGIFKVDYALSEPIPWQAAECAQAATVHLGGSYDEIALSERTVVAGRCADRPFVLVAQPSLFDPSRAPAGKHVAWAYCHVPHGSDVDMLPAIEGQLERFAPGFRNCVLARRVFCPSDLESCDANLVGGDIAGGALDYRQFLFRPTRRLYSTTARDVFMASSSTPPGGGVHGMCGYHAARTALGAAK